MEILKDVIKSLRNLSQLEDGEPVFPGFIVYPLDDKNFHDITERNGKIAFIDGGNAQILSAANFSLSFVRVYSCIFESNRKASMRKKEFFVLVNTEVIDNDVIYKTEVFSDWLEMPDFSNNDPTIKEGMFAFDTLKIAGITRRFAEWKMASELADVDLIVMDGTLQAGINNEKEFSEAAYKNAIKNNIILAALAKTSSLVTSTGNDLLSVLKRRGPDKWLYHPIADITSEAHRAEICAVKLHEHAKHAFRFEILENQKEKLRDAVSLLTANSNDYRFPGYPYGLVDADQFARVSEKECIYLRSLFASLNIDESTSDAHNVLNRIFR